MRRQHDPRDGENDLDVVLGQPGAEEALPADEQHEHQTGDHRRDREGQVDQGGQQRPTAEAELGNRPPRAQSEHQVCRDRDRGSQEGEPQRRQRVGLHDGGEVGAEAVREAPRRTRRSAERPGTASGTRAPARSAASGRTSGSVSWRCFARVALRTRSAAAVGIMPTPSARSMPAGG